jgi:hypothetical protein
MPFTCLPKTTVVVKHPPLLVDLCSTGLFVYWSGPVRTGTGTVLSKRTFQALLAPLCGPTVE